MGDALVCLGSPRLSHFTIRSASFFAEDFRGAIWDAHFLDEGSIEGSAKYKSWPLEPIELVE